MSTMASEMNNKGLEEIEFGSDYDSMFGDDTDEDDDGANMTFPSFLNKVVIDENHLKKDSGQQELQIITSTTESNPSAPPVDTASDKEKINLSSSQSLSNSVLSKPDIDESLFGGSSCDEGSNDDGNNEQDGNCNTYCVTKPLLLNIPMTATKSDNFKSTIQKQNSTKTIISIYDSTRSKKRQKIGSVTPKSSIPTIISSPKKLSLQSTIIPKKPKILFQTNVSTDVNTTIKVNNNNVSAESVNKKKIRRINDLKNNRNTSSSSFLSLSPHQYPKIEVDQFWRTLRNWDFLRDLNEYSKIQHQSPPKRNMKRSKGKVQLSLTIIEKVADTKFNRA